MKTLKLFTYYLLGMLLFLYSGNSMPEIPLTGLPGSELALKDAVAKADLIVTATLRDRGGPRMSGPGRAAFEGAKIEIHNVLKGSASGEMEVTIYVCLVRGPDGKLAQETPPEAGKEYIFCINIDNTTNPPKTVSKMLPIDNATLDAVKAAIDSAAN